MRAASTWRPTRAPGSRTTSWAGRGSGRTGATRCSTPTAGSGSSTTSTSRTGHSCPPRAAPTRRSPSRPTRSASPTHSPRGCRHVQPAVAAHARGAATVGRRDLRPLDCRGAPGAAPGAGGRNVPRSARPAGRSRASWHRGVPGPVRPDIQLAGEPGLQGGLFPGPGLPRPIPERRRPERYRSAVSEARSNLDISVLKAQVFLDGQKLANLLRIEYRASRLIELARESGRILGDDVIGWVRVRGKALSRDQQGRLLTKPDGTPQLEDRVEEHPVKLHFSPWIDAYQVEIWQTLEPPAPGTKHHFQVLAQMGPTGSITRVRTFSPILEVLDALKVVELAFRESDVEPPYRRPIVAPTWDNNYERSYQAPNTPVPSDNARNTVPVNNYLVDFQKGWYLDANAVPPVRYRNAMMDADPRNPEYVPPELHPDLSGPAVWQGDVAADAFARANVIEMRWILQREFGGSMVF